MLNTLLFVHLIIAVLLVIVILLQRTSTDGLSGIGGGNNMGLVSGRSAANFFTKTTIILTIFFFCNALILANLSTRTHSNLSDKMENIKQQQNSQKDKTIKEERSLPMAK